MLSILFKKICPPLTEKEKIKKKEWQKTNLVLASEPWWKRVCGVFIAHLSFIQFHGLFKSNYEVGAAASGC